MQSGRTDQTAQKVDHRVKFQPVEPKRPKLDRKLRRKTNCPIHGQKLLLKCAEQGCKQPYICLNLECIQNHFHSPILKVSKVDIASFQQKLERAEVAMANSEKLFGEAFQIKAIIDSLKNSVTCLFKDVGGMGRAFSDLKAEVDTTLSNAFLGKVDEALKIENRISASIERIKSKINLVQPQPATQPARVSFQSLQPTAMPPGCQGDYEFFMKGEISGFLQANICNFDWKTASKLISTRQRQYSCQEFHEALAGKQNLVFLFIAQNMLVGSYFSCPYPAIGREQANPRAKDAKSFIFAARQEPTLKILKFLANSDSPHHIQVSSHFYVSHGHLQDDAINSLDAGLPTGSYVAENTEEEDVNQAVKLLEILVLQVGASMSE